MTQLIFYKYYFQLIASEGKITINGKLRINVDQTSNQNFNDIKNVGFKGAPSRKAFEEMERIAALFEGKKTYQ
ncbi:MAG: hypothetical protein R2879_17835 [Saprospiraceae bacterium]